MQRQGAGSHSVHPPRAERGHDQVGVPQRAENPGAAADDREQQPFVEEQPSDRRRLEADRPQQSNLARALLHAELEEQDDQQQRGHDQEEAEVDEVLSEIGGALRCRQAFGADISYNQAGARQRIDAGAQTLLDLIPDFLKRRDGLALGRRRPYGRERAVS